MRIYPDVRRGAKGERPPNGKEVPLDALWIVISFIFVFGTIGVVTFAFGRMFGGFHLHHR